MSKQFGKIRTKKGRKKEFGIIKTKRVNNERSVFEKLGLNGSNVMRNHNKHSILRRKEYKSTQKK
jgi:hypothetical protein